MRYNNNYYCQLYHPELIEILEANKIRYRITGGTITPRFVSFSIWDTSANARNIIKEIAEVVDTEPIVTVEYSASELAAARLIWIRPTKQYVDITNTQEAYISFVKQ